MLRRGWILMGVLVVTAGLTACAPSPLPEDEAVAQYEGVMADVVDALQGAYPDVAWETTGETRAAASTGECRLHVATREAEESLLAAAGDWIAVDETLRGPLEEGGFGDLAEEEVDGGWSAAVATDARGGRLQLSDKGRATITLSVPLDGAACDAA